MKKEFHVVGAVIVKDGKIFAAQRGIDKSLPGLWEFPGGKIESGETPRGALEREIKEELLAEITVGDELVTVRHEYDFAVIHLTTFLCQLIQGEPSLTEHTELRWVSPDELSQLDWAPADIPTIRLLTKKFGVSEGE